MIGIEVANITLNFPTITEEEYKELIKFLHENYIEFNFVKKGGDKHD